MRQLPLKFGFTTDLDPSTVLEDLDYADDVALLDETEAAASDHITSLGVLANKVGLSINMDKTKFIFIPEAAQDLTHPSGEILQQVKDFKYLGSMMSCSATDLKCRRGLAWSTFWKMKIVWRANDVPFDLQRSIFQATCYPYSCMEARHGP